MKMRLGAYMLVYNEEEFVTYSLARRFYYE